MKRLILTIAVLALLTGGALFAQTPQDNMAAPSPNTTDQQLAPETEQGEGMDVDVDTGARAEGAVDVDVDSTTDADTSASGVDETAAGTYTGTADTDALPGTASELPTLALIGLVALAAAFLVRVKRHA